MKKVILSVLASFTLISGCTSNNFEAIPYGCDGEESGKYCASIEEIFNQSKAHDERNINVLADDDEIIQDGEYRTIQSQKKIKNSKNSTEDTINDTQTMSSGKVVFGSRALEQRPVYTPERVHRLFRGPWMDDYEILHSGEHLFYKTPGSWNYGNMSEPGSASGLVTPVYPEDLGFSKPGEKASTVEKTRVGRHVLPAANQQKTTSTGSVSSAVEALKEKAKKLN